MVWCNSTGELHFDVYVQMVLEIGTECTYDSGKVVFVSWSLAVAAALMIPLLGWIYCKTKEKEKKITTPQGMPYSETYCTVSLQLIQLTKVNIVLHQLVMPLAVILLLMTPQQLMDYYYFENIQNDLDNLHCTKPSIFLKRVNWLTYCRLLTEAPLLTVLDLIFWVQTVEWMAMNNLIENQKHKTVEEIIIDHHAEKMDLALSTERNDIRASTRIEADLDLELRDRKGKFSIHQVVYRRKELRLKKITTVISWIQTIVLYISYALYNIMRFNELQIPSIVIRLFILTVQLYFFIRLFVNMRQFHHFEFNKSKANMLTQIVIIGFTQLFRIFYTTLELIFDHREPPPSCSSPPVIEDKFADEVMRSVGFKFTIVFFYILFLENLVADIVVVFLKSSQDILQGVSKLDYLLKVSEFQRYKGSAPVPEKRKLSLGSVQSFERVSSSNETMVEESSSQFLMAHSLQQESEHLK